MQNVVQQAFDSEAFGIPFYRVVAWAGSDLEKELSVLLSRRPIVIDAKVGADQLERNAFLQRLGFRNVCTQLALRLSPPAGGRPEHRIAIGERLHLPADVVGRHVRNFRVDRFAMDILLDPAGHERLYAQWIANSLSGRMLVASHGENFCSFRAEKSGLAIDLLSVLNQKQGIGRSLVRAIIGYAEQRGLQEVRVVTECANRAAWRLYQDSGFRLDGFLNCYHFVAA